jgi:hypothetical protein
VVLTFSIIISVLEACLNQLINKIAAELVEQNLFNMYACQYEIIIGGFDKLG